MRRLVLALGYTVIATAIHCGASRDDARAITPRLPRIEVPAPRVAPTTIKVHIDVDPSVSAEVVAGITAWANATRGWRDWGLAPPSEAHVTIVEVGPGGGHCPSGSSACASQIGGLETDAPHGRIFMIRGAYEIAARLITIHELGHTLGLTHFDGGVMQSNPTLELWIVEWQCPDSITLMRLSWIVGQVLQCQPKND